MSEPRQLTVAGVRAMLGRAIALHQAGDLAAAERAYRDVLAVVPGFFQALHWLGVIMAMQGRLDEAADLLGQAVAADGTTAQAASDYANVLLLQRRLDEALASHDRALALDANLAQAWSNRGIVLQDLHRYEEALASQDRGLALQPVSAGFHNNRGATLIALGRLDEAVDSYTQALAIQPDLFEALDNRGGALSRLGRYPEAIADLERVLARQPDKPGVRGQLLHARLYCCDWTNLADESATIVAAVRAGKPVVTPFAFIAITDAPGDQLQCAQTWARREAPLLDAPSPAGMDPRHDRIRVAYLSSNFCDHALAFLLVGVFEGHDRARFEITGIAIGPTAADAMRLRLESAFEHFIDAKAMSNAAIAAMMRDRQIDIAIALDGWTTGDRVGVLAARAAPIQINYLGFPGTMGTAFIDYIIADRFVIPAGAEVHFSEAVVYLPDTFQANDATRAIAARKPTRAEAGLPAQAFVYCTFNSQYKITPRMFDIWMRLLRQREGSVLWLLGGNAAIEGNLQREVRARGVDPARLIFAPRLRYAEHLARYPLADLFLDTLPFNAGTTASDALWAGLPVLTCPGAAFAARMAGSVLQALGLPELVAPSLAAYETMAVALAADATLLAGIRRKLADHRDRFPAFDTDRFRRHLEAAYVAMWERHQCGETPAGFAVHQIGPAPP